jgi:uncharacterized protein
MTEILAYVFLGLTGVSFGLVGAGGAILVIPIMVYMLGVSATEATVLALPVSVLVSSVGASMGAKNREVDWGTVLRLGVPTALFSFLVRRIVESVLPKTLFGLPTGNVLMLLFSLILLTAGLLMIKARRYEVAEKPSLVKAVLAGSLVGVLSGVFGVGGGFIIVPVLVLVLGLEMKRAVPTSLACVVLITSMTFIASLTKNPALPLGFLAGVMGVAVVGMVIGVLLRAKVDGGRLKSGFGCLVLGVGVLVIGLEIFKLTQLA